MKYTAIVLAGQRAERDALAEHFGIELKALIPVAGEPMIRRPVQALLQSAHVDRIVVLAQAQQRIAEVLPDDPRISVRGSEKTIAGTLLDLCLDRSTRWPMLVTTADHALLDAAIVDEFCSRASGDLSIGVVERRNLLRRFPNAKRTWIEFRGGAYTGANLFALQTPKVSGAIELWRSVESERKKGWRVVSALGPFILIATLLRLLTLDRALRRVGRKIGLEVNAVRLSDPLAGVDVDKLEDHALAQAVLDGRA